MSERTPVDKERAARTALDALDEVGLEKLTVRLVASRLGVRAPALYWHFENKRALLDQMTDILVRPAVADLGRPGRGRPWWRWLEDAAVALHGALLSRRDGARVASGARLPRAVALGTFVERATEVLHAAGFGLADASRAAGALMHFVVGRAVEDQERPAAGTETAALSGAGFPFPTLARAMRERHAAGATLDDDFRG
jgi:TetR/AcrR family tetracycline transcriptional repressor